jgi:hypothetical protein
MIEKLPTTSHPSTHPSTASPEITVGRTAAEAERTDAEAGPAFRSQLDAQFRRPVPGGHTPRDPRT